jgi:hypothetical protein
MPVHFPAGPVRQRFQQSGAPGYLLFLTEQAATPVIHAGIKSRELFDAVGTATAGVRRAQRLRNSAERRKASAIRQGVPRLLAMRMNSSPAPWILKTESAELVADRQLAGHH